MYEHLDTIRRRNDGCIDTEHYLQRGRVARSQLAHGLLASLAGYIRWLLNVPASNTKMPAEANLSLLRPKTPLPSDTKRGKAA